MTDRTLTHRLYHRLLRPHLPMKIGVHAGVPVRRPRLLDRTDHVPDYKPGLLDAIHNCVKGSDAVTLVGFGQGVTTVHALQENPEEVTAYEGAGRMIDIGLETLELAEANTSRVTVVHAVVGSALDVYGPIDDVEHIAPAELSGDVLICDCEGAELSILNGLDADAFNRLIIETHPSHDAGEVEVIRHVPDRFHVDVNELHPDRPEKAVVVATR